jgi:hypothetical protein
LSVLWIKMYRALIQLAASVATRLKLKVVELFAKR